MPKRNHDIVYSTIMSHTNTANTSTFGMDTSLTISREEAKAMNLIGLPCVTVNTMYDHTSMERIGEITHACTHEDSTDVLIALQRAGKRNEFLTHDIVRTFICEGLYKTCNFCHTTEIACDSTIVKTPVQVGIFASRPRNYNTIKDIFLCRASIRELFMRAPECLDEMIRRFGYEDELKHVSKNPASVYIAALANLCEQRYQHTLQLFVK